MSQRAAQLHATADRQIAELADLVGALDVAALQRPCPGREKLGDGTVAANAEHTAHNYRRIAEFVQTAARFSAAGGPNQPGAHRAPQFHPRLGHGPADHRSGGAHPHGTQYTADSINSTELVKQLSASRRAVAEIAALTDSQLESIPPEGSFRFCDGQRTLEQVLTSLLKHQGHQLQALERARS